MNTDKQFCFIRVHPCSSVAKCVSQQRATPRAKKSAWRAKKPGVNSIRLRLVRATFLGGAGISPMQLSLDTGTIPPHQCHPAFKKIHTRAIPLYRMESLAKHRSEERR